MYTSLVSLRGNLPGKGYILVYGIELEAGSELDLEKSWKVDRLTKAQADV